MFRLVKIWQVSSCEKFMQHLETCLLIAEADRVLCHLGMFLTVFFYWMYKMKYSCYQDSSVIHGWFVYRDFGWEMHRLSKSLETDFGWHRFQKWAYSLALVWGVRGLKSIKRFCPHLMALRSCISTQLSTGKPEQLLSLMVFFFRFLDSFINAVPGPTEMWLALQWN